MMSKIRRGTGHSSGQAGDAKSSIRVKCVLVGDIDKISILRAYFNIKFPNEHCPAVSGTRNSDNSYAK